MKKTIIFLLLGLFLVSFVSSANLVNLNTPIIQCPEEQDLSPYWKSDGTSSASGNWNLGIYDLTADFFIGDGSQLTGITQLWENVSGVATYDGDVNVTGNITANTLTITEPGSGNYIFSALDNPTGLALRNSVSGTSRFDLFSNDGDGLDAVFQRIWGYGQINQLANAHNLQMGWTPAGYYYIQTGHAGTQTDKPLQISTQDNPEQLVLNTNGSVNIGTDLIVGDALTVNGITNFNDRVAFNGETLALDAIGALQLSEENLFDVSFRYQGGQIIRLEGDTKDVVIPFGDLNVGGAIIGSSTITGTTITGTSPSAPHVFAKEIASSGGATNILDIRWEKIIETIGDGLGLRFRAIVNGANKNAGRIISVAESGTDDYSLAFETGVTGSLTKVLTLDSNLNAIFEGAVFADKLILGQDNESVNSSLDISSGDVVGNIAYFNAFMGRSPAPICDLEDLSCAVFFPKYQKTLWIDISEDWTINKIVFDGESYTTQEFNSQVCSTNENTQKICQKLTDKFTKLQENYQTNLLTKQQKEACGYSWDGECFEIVKNIVTYSEAVEMVEVDETIGINTTCYRLGDDLKVVEYSCVIQESTGSKVNVPRFKGNCDWEGDYYCEVREVRLN